MLAKCCKIFFALLTFQLSINIMLLHCFAIHDEFIELSELIILKIDDKIMRDYITA